MQIDSISEIKSLSCYEKINEILRGKIPVPRSIDFYIINSCNHSCIGCHTNELIKYSPKHLKFSILKKVIEEAAKLGIEGVAFVGTGEPLLHPQIKEIVRYVSSKRLKLGLITNGSLINAEIAKLLLQKASFVRISLDAATKETYKAVHRADDFNKVTVNIKNLIKKRKKGKPVIGVKFLISQLNYNEVLLACQTARDMGVDYIQFKALRNDTNGIKQSQIPEIQSLLQKAKILSCDSFGVLGSIEKTGISTKCFLTPLHSFIDASGNVCLCTYFQHREESHKIGNIYQSSFTDIWYSQKHKDRLKNIDIRQCNTYDCRFHKRIELVSKIMSGRMNLEFI